MDYDEVLLDRFNSPLYIKKSIQELQGIAAAIIYDNKLDDSEIRFLFDWVKNHIDIDDEYPINKLAPLLGKVIKKGKCTADLRDEILSVLKSFAADTQAPPVVDDLFDLNCQIKFKNCKFLFTGKLTSGSRTDALKLVSSCDGIPLSGSSVTRDLDYLVVGDLGNTSWKYSRFGGKIEKAIEIRKVFGKPFIISEDQFFKAANEITSNIVTRAENAGAIKNCLCGKVVSFTGTFEYLSRIGVINAIQRLGGIYSNNVTQNVNFLIIGNITVPDKKYEKAIKNKVTIISKADFDSMFSKFIIQSEK